MNVATFVDHVDLSRLMSQDTFYVAGWGSRAGKSTICKALLHYIHNSGRSCSYIKPVTQCEAVTDVAAYCDAVGIPNVPIGPIVFRPGVTNTMIASDDFHGTRARNLSAVVESVKNLHADTQYVVVDGVGYPSVGSCAGVGNGDVAHAINARVILVCPDGLGDALDTMELMMHYFLQKQCTVVAVVFNKVRDSQRHKRSDVEPLITKYITERYPNVKMLGFVAASETPDTSHIDFATLFACQ